jgi:hypothetical protein
MYRHDWSYYPIGRLLRLSNWPPRPRKPSLTNLLDLLWLALDPIETRQILQARDDIGVTRFEGPPSDTKRPTIEKFGLVWTSEVIANDREAIESICDVGMCQPQVSLLEFENQAKSSFRSHVVSGDRRPLRLGNTSFDFAKLRHSARSHHSLHDQSRLSGVGLELSTIAATGQTGGPCYC